MSSSSAIDQSTGFGFNTNSNGNKNYFIKRGDVNYQVNLAQIPFDIQERLGLRSPNAVRPVGASSFSFDNNTGLIYSVNYSILSGPFSIFDPVSRYGFSGYRLNPPNDPPNKDYIYYFIQNEYGTQFKVPSYFLPENVKTLLQTGIRENITQDFILPEDEIPTPINHDLDPRCPSACFHCQCDPEKRKLSQKLYEDVQNNPDPKYPMGCSFQVTCSCAICTRIDFTPGIAPGISPGIAPSIAPGIAPGIAPSIVPSIAPSFSPRPEGLTDPEGSSGITPVFAPGITPVYTPSMTPRPEGLTEEPFLSFWNKYEYLILGGLALITIIIMIIMFKN